MNPLTPHAAMDRLMIFAGNANPRLAQDVVKKLNISLGRAVVDKFSDGEVMVEIMENVRGKDVFVLQSTCQPTNDNLMELGLRLGADVPFFLFGRNALGEGVGEHLQGLDLAPAWYLVLTPQVSVSTKEIFSDAALTRNTKPLTMSPFLSGQGRNDLEPIALRRYPEIAEHLAWLRKRSPPGCFLPRMTGSGACVFAEFSRREEAVALHGQLPPAMRGFVVRGLELHPLHDWAN